MNDEQIIYISPADDMSDICERLEHVGSRYAVLVIPHDNQLRAFATWRILHAHIRRRGIRVRIVSTSAYIRSLARNARFTVAQPHTTSKPEKALRTRPSPHVSPPARSVESIDAGERANLLFAPDDEVLARPVRQFSHTEPKDDSFAFVIEDVLPPHLMEPPVRVPKTPQPLNMPHIRRTRPLTPPRLPWDDVDNELLPPRRPRLRRTGPLSHIPLRSHSFVRAVRHRREPANALAVMPFVLIGIFVLVRSIVRYLRKR